MNKRIGRDINLRHLRAFTEVHRCGSVSSAAAIVHLSQPAITQALAKLETTLGVQLFMRSSKGMYPTEPAALLAIRAERALGFLKQGVQNSGRRPRQGHVDGLITATQLRALLAVEDHGSFTLAARALGVAQPSVYRAARDLEKILDLKFYVKTLQGYDLTRSATMIARAARLMFAELDQAIMEIAEWQGKDSSEITIGGLPLARSTILPQTLSRLSRARPKMRIRVVEGPYSDLLHALRHGEIDVVVGALRFPPPADDVVQETLFKDRLGVFAGPNHPLAHKGKLNIDDLALYPWVMPHSETPTRAIFERFMAALATPEHRNVIETSSMVLVRSLLQDNEHLTMLSVNQMHFDEDAGSVCRLPVELEDAPRPIGVTSRTDWHPTSAQSEFLEILREVSLTFG